MRTCTRSDAISDLRTALVAACDDEHSICLVARQRGLFCRGFAQWKLHELRARYPQITRSRPGLQREALEELANRWQLARQEVLGEALACDVQQGETTFRTCRGWDEFSDEELARFHDEICGEAVRIEPAAG